MRAKRETGARRESGIVGAAKLGVGAGVWQETGIPRETGSVSAKIATGVGGWRRFGGESAKAGAVGCPRQFSQLGVVSSPRQASCPGAPRAGLNWEFARQEVTNTLGHKSLVGILILGLVAGWSLAGCALAPHGSDTISGNAAANSRADRLRPGPNALPNYVNAAAIEPNTRLLPSTAVDKEASKITRLVFSGLAYLDEEGKVKNDIASAIIPNENCTLYDIEIRPELYFSDGTLVKAVNFARTWSDIVRNADTRPEATLLRAVRGFRATAGMPEATSGQATHPAPSPGSKIGGAGQLTPELDGVEVLSNTHFRVHLDHATCDFMSRIATPVFAPLPLAAFDANGKILASFVENPYGYGPYMLAREGAWERGVQLNLVPNERYLGPRLAKNEGVSFKFYHDRDASYKDLQSDELDVDDALPRAALKTYRDQLGSRSEVAANSVTSYLVVPRDTRFSAATEEGRLRRLAISMSLNRAEIVRTYFAAKPVPATDFVSPAVLGHGKTRPGNEVLKFDAARAKSTWEAANALAPWEGDLALARVDNEPGEWIEDAASQIRETLGVNVRVLNFPDRVALHRAEAEAQAAAATRAARAESDGAAGAGGDAESDKAGEDGTSNARQNPPLFAYADTWEPKYPGMNAYLWPMFAADGIANVSGYRNAEFDELLRRARTEVSEYAASKIYSKAGELLLRDLPVIPLWYEKSVVGWSTKVAGITLDWQGVPQYWRITKD